MSAWRGTSLLDHLRSRLRLGGSGRGEVAALSAEVARLRAEVARSESSDVARRLSKFRRELTMLQQDYERLARHLAATETRLELLADGLDAPSYEGDDADHAQARALVDEIRREHEQIRVRFQVVTAYEERLGRVERTLSEGRGSLER